MSLQIFYNQHKGLVKFMMIKKEKKILFRKNFSNSYKNGNGNNILKVIKSFLLM